MMMEVVREGRGRAQRGGGVRIGLCGQERLGKCGRSSSG